MDKQKLPNAQAVLILGILSVITCCCYGVVGIILGIVALVMAKKDMQTYNAAPELYSNYSQLNVGRVLAIIGITISTIYLAIVLYLLIAVGPEGLMEMQKNLMEKAKYQEEMNQ